MVRLHEFEIRAHSSPRSCVVHSQFTFRWDELVQVMASRQLFSLMISAALFGHDIKLKSLPYGIMVFGAMGYKIRKQVKTRGINMDSVSQSKTSSTLNPTRKMQ